MPQVITLPQGRVPFGYVYIQGQKLPIEIEPEWMKALSLIVQRTGGTTAQTAEEILQDIRNSVARLRIPVLFQDNECDGSHMPGPPGKDGKNGVTTFLHVYDDPPESEPYFMRIP